MFVTVVSNFGSVGHLYLLVCICMFWFMFVVFCFLFVHVYESCLLLVFVYLCLFGVCRFVVLSWTWKCKAVNFTRRHKRKKSEFVIVCLLDTYDNFAITHDKHFNLYCVTNRVMCF